MGFTICWHLMKMVLPWFEYLRLIETENQTLQQYKQESHASRGKCFCLPIALEDFETITHIKTNYTGGCALVCVSNLLLFAQQCHF